MKKHTLKVLALLVIRKKIKQYKFFLFEIKAKYSMLAPETLNTKFQKFLVVQGIILLYFISNDI